MIFPRLINKKFQNTTLILLFLYFYGVTISYLLSRFKYNNYKGFIDFTITFTLSIITYIVCNYYFSINRKFSKNHNEYIDNFFKLSVNKCIYTIILIIGLLQILNLIHIVPDVFVQAIGKVISGSVRNDRVKLVSSEPSWASIQLLYILPILLYLKSRHKNKYYKIAFYFSIVLFIGTFSILGFIAISLAYIIYLVVNSKNKFLLIFKIVFALILVICFLKIMTIIGNTVWKNSYFTNHFNIFNNLDSWNKFYDFLLTDDSAYVRIIMPLVGVIMFLRNPFIGIGGGNYRFEFNNIMLSYFPDGLAKGEIYSNDINLTSNPRNLYIKFLCELGIIGSVILTVFIWNILNHIKFIINPEIKKYIIFWIICVLCMFLQFDSLACVNLWIALAFINNLEIDR